MRIHKVGEARGHDERRFRVSTIERVRQGNCSDMSRVSIQCWLADRLTGYFINTDRAIDCPRSRAVERRGEVAVAREVFTENDNNYE